MDNERTRYKKIKEAHPEWSLQDVTKRIKKVSFDSPTSPESALIETVELWKAAKSIYDQPLIQLRAILEQEHEAKLLSLIAEGNKRLDKDTSNLRIAGRLLFKEGSKKYGIYYMQFESLNRPSYRDEKYLEHSKAVSAGFTKRSKEKWALPDGYKIYALDFSNGALDILTGEKLNLNPEDLAQKIADVHKLAFKFPHDPAQQTKEGVLDILMNNPTLVCFDQNGNVSSVGFMERDSRFTFSKSVLIEPTYFTHPAEGRKGLSSHLRQATKKLTERHHLVSGYNGNPMIVFNESIRHSSFVLCLENGCNLAGTDDLTINGDLGEAYTAIGPANPETGFMPMGLTYFISPSIDPNR